MENIFDIAFAVWIVSVILTVIFGAMNDVGSSSGFYGFYGNPKILSWLLLISLVVAIVSSVILILVAII